MRRFVVFQFTHTRREARKALAQVKDAGLSPLRRALWVLGRMLPYVARRAAGLALWAAAARLGPRVGAGIRERCCVILLSYRRPANMDLIVRACLKCDFVSRVIVSNNDPSCRLSDWVKVKDPRLRLLDQERVTRQGIRLALAQAEPFEFVLTVDDDRFLRPTQFAALFQHVLADRSVPHGIEGEKRATEGERTQIPGYPYRLGVTGTETRVDSLTGVYCLTRAHVTRSFELLAAVGVHDLGAFANGEDIVMSYAGDGDPRIHDLGSVEHCFASWAEEIATSTTPGFFKERLLLKHRLASLRTRADDGQAAPREGAPHAPPVG